MDTYARVAALKKVQDEIDELSTRIDTIIKENEEKIEDNVDAICKQIEKDLEEIYEMTDERIYRTRHLGFNVNGYHYHLAFDGTANVMYFLDTESVSGCVGNDKTYHIVIAEHGDASGRHFYEDGKWRDRRTKEIFASYWDQVKKDIENEIIRIYEYEQKQMLESCIKQLNNSATRLANVSRKEG